jgi:hypothetical protein
MCQGQQLFLLYLHVKVLVYRLMSAATPKLYFHYPQEILLAYGGELTKPLLLAGLLVTTSSIKQRKLHLWRTQQFLLLLGR